MLGHNNIPAYALDVKRHPMEQVFSHINLPKTRVRQIAGILPMCGEWTDGVGKLYSYYMLCADIKPGRGALRGRTKDCFKM